MAQKITQPFGTKNNHATSWHTNKITQTLGIKKSRHLLAQKKSRSLFAQKIMQPLGTKKIMQPLHTRGTRGTRVQEYKSTQGQSGQ